MTQDSSPSYLDRFLNVYWLRPENALWRTLDCHALADIRFEEPSLDVGCGHGVFSFIRAGGDFSRDFDVYSSIENTTGYADGNDIYDAVDVWHPAISRQPDYRITMGIDRKANLLDKARTLGIYRDLQVVDCNGKMPFEAGSFETIYTNIADEIQQRQDHLADMATLLTPSGKLVMTVKTSRLYECRMEALAPGFSENWIQLIDRGRSATYADLPDLSGWSELLDSAGLELLEARSAVGSMQGSMWEVGLRPLSPVLIKMTNSLNQEARLQSKAEWIEVWKELLEPFCSPLPSDIDDAVEVLLIARRAPE